MAHFKFLLLAFLLITFQPLAYAYIRFDLTEFSVDANAWLPGQSPEVIVNPGYGIKEYIDSGVGDVHGDARARFTTPLSPWGFESYVHANAKIRLTSPSEVTATARATQSVRFTTDRPYIISVESFALMRFTSFLIACHASSKISNLPETPEFNFEVLLDDPNIRQSGGFRRNCILPAGSYIFEAIADTSASQFVGTAVLNGMAAEIESKLKLYPLPDSAPEGDYDSDGVVSGSDFLKWQRDFGNPAGEDPAADGDSNGVVDAFDLDIWKAFRAPPEIPTDVWESIYNPSPLPEPSTLTLAASAAVVLQLARSAQRANRRKVT